MIGIVVIAFLLGVGFGMLSGNRMHYLEGVMAERRNPGKIAATVIDKHTGRLAEVLKVHRRKLTVTFRDNGSIETIDKRQFALYD